MEEVPDELLETEEDMSKWAPGKDPWLLWGEPEEESDELSSSPLTDW